MNKLKENIRIEIARRVARDIPEGAYVNLGIGLPTLVANHLPRDKEIFLHSENGVLGRWQAAPVGEEDWDMINAGKEAIQIDPGSVFFHHADSFAMMRGGHIDICVLGAFQVSQSGDLANWHTGKADAIPGVGGAMDLAIGAKKVFVMMEHLDKTGVSKLVRECTYPLTGLRCVSRVYTELATFELADGQVKVVELADDVSPEYLQEVTALELDFSAVPSR
ncbi:MULTISPECIES: 3-oxoacid CoA-transferase subunit B [Pseudomonas]|uniref:3-oxoacid CoA-transferase subunit B n=1 Tax=Pseudomonas TaxID=286 RepID=UPI0009E3E1CC|nr:MULTISPECIES: 3-oxoacid CoA-transferase subunit B [Pseudomonas]MBH1967235.1 3-oxoacid CoA-transferase subunit B [Pseudomonadales bacterium]MBH2077009.1 3-oxoacid CoA-transferase subunit B [Pseudomonadales bacterium]